MDRVQKILANEGICSRRKAEELIQQKQVRVNGKIAVIGQKADLATDRIHVNGELVMPVKKRYIILNKPKGIISEARDALGRGTVVNLLRQKGVKDYLIPVDKIDRNMEGLILLTNDGEIAQRVMHPRFEIQKTYRLKLNKVLTDGHAERLERGIVTKQKTMLRPVHLKRRGLIVEISTHQSKDLLFHVLSDLHYEIIFAVRISIGTVNLHGLKPGDYRDLTKEEIEWFRQH